MAKLKAPLFSFGAVGTLAKRLTMRRSGPDTIAENTPKPKDARTPAQLAWRPMYKACAVLWHTLSAAEKSQWESQARPKHMTGYAWFMSQCLKPNPGIYLPLAGGTMSGEIDMGTNKIVNLKAPTNPNDAARLADAGAGTGKRIEDADQDTYVDTEKNADEDQVRMGVAGVEAFHLDNAGILTLAKQSAAHVCLTSEQSNLVNDTWTKLSLDNEQYDLNNDFASYKFTVPVDGRYHVVGALAFIHTLADSIHYVAIYKNGALVLVSRLLSGSGAIACAAFVMATLEFTTNDYIELYAKHIAGINTVDVTPTTSWTWLTIHKLS